MNVGKKTWIIFGGLCIVIIATVLVLLLVLVPQVTTTGIQTNKYEPIAKQEYTFDGSEVENLKKQYGITEQDVNKGKKNNKYEEGNINPFTPNNEVTIYNEPTLEKENNKNNANGSTNLTPDQK